MRSKYWDNLKGILIVLVVLGHFLWAYSDISIVKDIIQFIYYFHMPAFIFIAGYFSKSENSKSLKALFKLFVIYLMFNTLMMGYDILILGNGFKIISPYYSNWFLISVISWRILAKYLGNIKGIFALSTIFALLVGLFLPVYNAFAIARTVAFFPFFILGYKLSKEKVESFISLKSKKKYISGALAFAFGALLIYIYARYTNLGTSSLVMSNYTNNIDLFYRIVVYIVAGLITYSLMVFTPSRDLNLLTTWGKNSLIIYGFHRIITLITLEIFKGSNYYIFVAIGLTFITCYLLGVNKLAKIFDNIVNKIISLFPVFNKKSL